MTAIADLSDHLNAATGGGSSNPEPIWAFWTDRQAGTAAASNVSNKWVSAWTFDGMRAGSGSGPGTTPAIPDNTTQGGLKQTDPAGGTQKWLTHCVVGGASVGAAVLYDRLLHQSGLSGTSTSAQTVGGSITRNTGGVGNEIWVEIYTLIGTTATTITASYTNQAGTSGRTTVAVAFGGTSVARNANQMIQLPLQSGDTGVQAVASVTLAASTGTAGSFGVTLCRPLWQTSSLGGVPDTRDVGIFSGTGPVEIPTDACLALRYYTTATTVPPHLWLHAMTYER